MKPRLVLGVLASLLMPGLLLGQQPAPAEALKIFVLVGEGAVHRVPLGLVTNPVVEVRDQADLPVEGAEVTFTLPATGPSGTFGGELQYRSRTGSHGQAAAAGFTPNSIEGRFQIEVTAVHQGRMGRTVIHQSNSMRAVPTTQEPRRGGIRRWLIWGGIATGAAVGITLAVTAGSPTPPTVTLTPGAPGIGAPR